MVGSITIEKSVPLASIDTVKNYFLDSLLERYVS